MDGSETIALIILLVFLGIGLVAAVIGVFLFNDTDWWDKL